jgi:mannitol/fructose-specific phosphotransferase system IIA component (Ntr-type)
MQLSNFFEPDALALPLRAMATDDALTELLGLLRLEERSSATVLKLLQRREELGSTGVGRGIAIPHSRSLVVNRVRLAYGYSPGGILWNAVDDRPVHHFFLIVAPPPANEVSNQYLSVLAKIATFAKEADVPDRLSRLTSAEEFFALLREKEA